VFILLVLGVIKSVAMYRVYHLLPLHELKRRARAGDAKASSIFKVAAFSERLDILLWLSGVICGVVVIIWSARYAWWLASLLIVLFSWLLIWAPKISEGGWLWNLYAFNSRYVFKFLSFADPVLAPLAKLWPPHEQVHLHAGLYEKEDLLQLLDTQNHLASNRIPQDELKMAQAALTFGDKKVSAAMTPRSKVRFVLAEETIGPMLMDELHKTGQVRFAVVEEIKKNIEPKVMGTLLLQDLIGREDEGPVTRLMKKGVHYINESASLHQAVDAFLKTHAHLLVVVNNFEEVAGILTLEDVLKQIVGKLITDEFYDYKNLSAVAGRHPSAAQEHHEPTV